MKFSYQNIHTLFRINRVIVISVAVMALLSSGFSGWMAYHIHKESLQNAFAIDSQGEVLPLKWEDQHQQLEVEALAHLERFHQVFYGIDASTFEAHMEKALWWGDASVDELYRQKKLEGTYNRLVQYSLVQEVTHVDTQIELEDWPLPFQTRTLFEIKRGTVIDRYELLTTGKLIQVERHFPNNPHGLLITDFFEKTLRKIQNEK
ncbi:conjugal transfer protein TraK [Croceitalea marina]|uniref:Conjugal transfer protein TraK n=1 Tax=Croceitalea marina TaxID=1775166 RepID=A0ABW5MV70_9FLAO